MLLSHTIAPLGTHIKVSLDLPKPVTDSQALSKCKAGLLRDWIMAAWQRSLHAASCWDFAGGSLISCPSVKLHASEKHVNISLRFITFLQTAWPLKPYDAMSIMYDLFSREYHTFGLKTLLGSIFSALLKFAIQVTFFKVWRGDSQRVCYHSSLPALSAHSNWARSYPERGTQGRGTNVCIGSWAAEENSKSSHVLLPPFFLEVKSFPSNISKVWENTDHSMELLLRAQQKCWNLLFFPQYCFSEFHNLLLSCTLRGIYWFLFSLYWSWLL